jgi:hypothetical protein
MRKNKRALEAELNRLEAEEEAYRKEEEAYWAWINMGDKK